MQDSPTPPAPSSEELEAVEDLERTTERSSIASPKISMMSARAVTQSNVPWRPKETDTSLLAADWRARRSTRLSEDNREAIGGPTVRTANGIVRQATGIWLMIEKQDDQLKHLAGKLKVLTDEHEAQKKSREDLTGFVKTRAERVFDKLFMMLVAALVAYFTRRAWLPVEPPPAAPSVPAVSPTPEKH